MKAKEFDEVNLRIAENQEEYETLPVHFDRTDGSILFCFELDDQEIARMRATGEVWFKMWTSGKPMPPIALSTNKEELYDSPE